MRIRIILLLAALLSVLGARASGFAPYHYRVGVIQDRDGYVNVRERPDSKSPVLVRILEGERFLIVETRGEWFLVRTLEAIGPGQALGYVHSSRVKVLRGDAIGAGRTEDADGYTNVRAAPSIESEVVGRVDEGDGFVILARSGEWCQILTRYGVEGYMHQSRIRVMLPDSLYIPDERAR